MPLDVDTLRQMFGFEAPPREKKAPVLELTVEGIVKKLKEFMASKNSKDVNNVHEQIACTSQFQAKLLLNVCSKCREESGGDDWSRDIHWWVNRGYVIGVGGMWGMWLGVGGMWGEQEGGGGGGGGGMCVSLYCMGSTCLMFGVITLYVC